MRHAPWKVIAVRVIVNAIAVAITVLVLPGLHVTTDRPVLGFLILGGLFGLINAFVKPLAQFVALPFLLGSMGLVVIVIDILAFWLLDALAPGLMDADRLTWVVAGGLLLGALSFFLDGLLGLTPPIVADPHEEATA